MSNLAKSNEGCSTNDMYGMTDDKFFDFLIGQGYINPKMLDDGEWVAMLPLAYTMSVFCGMDVITPFKYRWCFTDPAEAKFFFDNMVDFDDIPTRIDSLSGHRYANNKPLLMMKDERGFIDFLPDLKCGDSYC